MRERPILFNQPMVRATLDGRKTQTRRVAKLTSGGHVKEANGHRRWHVGDPDAVLACPFGAPGDRLWVRETFFDSHKFRHAPLFEGGPRYYYRADSSFIGCHRWTPSIQMPKAASRLTLEVVSVRVERLQDISEVDAVAEGCSRIPMNIESVAKSLATLDRWNFAATWEALYGSGSWDANPWVWVVEFKRLGGVA